MVQVRVVNMAVVEGGMLVFVGVGYLAAALRA